MTRDHELGEFAAARQPTDAEREALDAIADKVRARGVLNRLRDRTDPDVAARGAAVAAHFAEDQP